MGNFCTNCGARLRKDDNFCTNCGTEIVKSDMKENNAAPDSIEKKLARKQLKKVVGGKLLYNETFSSELRKNGLNIVDTGKAIRQQVEKEIDSGQITSGGVEFRVNQLIQKYKIQKEEENKKLAEKRRLEAEKRTEKLRIIRKKEEDIQKIIEKHEKSKLVKEKERNSSKIEETEMSYGGYCDFNCIHCYEEILDSGGGVVADYTGDGMVEYYCNLGHTISDGRFCEDYE